MQKQTDIYEYRDKERQRDRWRDGGTDTERKKTDSERQNERDTCSPIVS